MSFRTLKRLPVLGANNISIIKNFNFDNNDIRKVKFDTSLFNYINVNTTKNCNKSFNNLNDFDQNGVFKAKGKFRVHNAYIPRPSCKLYVNDIIKKDLDPLMLPLAMFFKSFAPKRMMDKCLYIISTVFFLNKTDRRNLSINDNVNVMQHALRDVLGWEYVILRDFLVLFGFIECDNHFVTGQKCLGFRLGEKYRKLIEQKKLKFYAKETCLDTQRHRITLNNRAASYIYENLKNTKFEPAPATNSFSL